MLGLGEMNALDDNLVVDFFDKEAFYSMFKLVPGISSDERNGVVDKLFNSWDNERRVRLIRYRNGEFLARSSEGNKARSDQQVLQKQYLREVDKMLNSFSFYDAFSDFPGVTKEKKKAIIDSLLAKLSDEQRRNAIRALNKEILIKDVPNLRADLRRIKSQYETLAKKNLVGRTIYNILPDIEGVTEEKKCEIADKLFGRFSGDRQNNMLKLLALEINSSCKMGHAAYQDLDVYKRQYMKYIDSIINGILNFALMVNNSFGLKLDAKMTFDKMDLLWSSLEIVEDAFRRNGRDKRPVYTKYMLRTLRLIINNNPTLDLQNLIIRYITVTYECILKRREAPLMENDISEVVAHYNDDLSIIREGLRQVFKGKRLEDFKLMLTSFYESCLVKYDYLRIAANDWQIMFVGIIKESLNEANMLAVIDGRINRAISKIIKEQFTDKKRRVALIDGMIKFQKGISVSNVLNNLKRLLENYSLVIDEEFYEILKKESRKFAYLLNALEIFTFSKTEFDAYLRGEYDIYLEIKPHFMSLDDTIHFTNYYFSLVCISEDRLKNNKFIDSLLKRKVALILRSNKILQNIQELYLQQFGNYDKKNFDRLIMMMPIEELSCLLEQYQLYMEVELESNIDISFINRLHNGIKTMEDKPRL